MKINKFIIPGCLLVLLSGFASCQKNSLKTSPFNGIWIEQVKKTDTIVFAREFDGEHATFELKRGFRFAEGYRLPDYFSGAYWYYLSDNNISLYWLLSSGSFHSYYFRMIPEESKFLIGNFFKNPENSSGESDTLVFVRIK